MKNVYLCQPQYAVEYRKENTYWLPYSIGCLWSYVNQFHDIQESFILKDMIFKRDNPDNVISKMEDPVLCGFSCYVWNEKYCLLLAEKIKSIWPNCKIIFGGAQTSKKFLKYKFIDSVILAEGEESFLQILRAINANQDLDQIYNKKRMQDLDIPSPYITGVFDKIIKDNPNSLWSMTFETNRGCPYACTFCDWGGVTYSKIKRFNLERVAQDLEWCVDKPVNYLICADANFGIFKERDIEIAKMIRSVADRGMIDSVNLQYTKNSTETVFDIAEILGDLSKGITVSVQSMNNDTLGVIKRTNLDINDLKKIMDISQTRNILTYTEVILGLPLETLETWKKGLTDILELGQHNTIEVWFAQLLENSEMHQDFYRKLYGIKSIIAKDYMPLYNICDWKGIDEEIELVNQTNTMTTDDMIESYMYAWLIIQFHVSGYSQIVSKYLRYNLNISYRHFYDKLFDIVKIDTFFKEYVDKMYSFVRRYLTTGEMTEFDNHKRGGHGIHAVSYEFMYKNKLEIFRIVESASSFFDLENFDVLKLQEKFIFDETASYPDYLELKVDVSTWKDVHTKYKISSRASIDEKFDFYQYRRKGFIKNRIEHES